MVAWSAPGARPRPRSCETLAQQARGAPPVIAQVVFDAFVGRREIGRAEVDQATARLAFGGVADGGAFQQRGDRLARRRQGEGALGKLALLAQVEFHRRTEQRLLGTIGGIHARRADATHGLLQRGHGRAFVAGLPEHVERPAQCLFTIEAAGASTLGHGNS
ncbi:hypothetical protein K652_18037 [Pseudomonas aeruginosa VRFPA02]|nr:hypothetical protein K652_18037 [Pseudomonas aeruginosa VRFPA02]